jgi:RLL motif-containing protein 1
MAKGRLGLKLDAMAYPYPLDMDHLDFAHFQKLVVWLEDTQIRALPEAQRAGLKAAVAPQQWWPSFVEYCKGVGYKKPLPLPRLEGLRLVPDDNLRMAVDWLVGKAIRFFYADDDGPARYNAAHTQWIQSGRTPLAQEAAEKAPSGGKAAASSAPVSFTVEDPQKLQELVGNLCDVLSLPRSGDPTTDLTLATRMIKQLVALGASKTPVQKSTAELLHDMPLGFTTGVPKLDNACKLLRVLYTADLRDLQDAIDETLIRLQNITGDPKTDTRLGKVGS